ncbi:MAG: KUP/HAK/KT family potassium transporter [Chitinispirillaceae bacterium]|nr:KUP/HAK/KT family potassium transporter [Chitinispirillaceae bacterium]
MINNGSKLSETKATLMLATLGVVFGDIGTSPLYALRECFIGPHSIPVSAPNVLGAVSIIFWFLVIVVCVKYVVFVMKADNKGEGGILALMALVHRIGPGKIRNLAVIPFLGILGAALLFSDGVLTPAISVLSAVEGLNVATPMFAPFVIPISLVVLAILFAFQSRGTLKIGAMFGPMVLIWFITIGIIGALSIARNPAVIHALNPLHAVTLLSISGWKSLALLGTAFLAVTGAEVLYADMGHFGKSPIRNTWFFIVFPALMLNYMGQGALLLRTGGNPENLFFQLSPGWFLYPLVIISTSATVIASQAVISGAFSLARQAVQLGFWPRTRVVHTSKSNIGQVYLPFINLALFVVTLLLVVGFKHSGNLASAYGIAVSATMLITTTLLLLIARVLWRVPRLVIVPIGLFFCILDISLFTANLSKFLSGGWIVVFIAAAIWILMTTWVAGRRILQKQVLAESIPVEQFVQEVAAQNLPRIQKAGIFLSGNAICVPRALLHNYKHNGILHARTIIVSVQTEESPYVPSGERCSTTDLGQGIYKIVLRYGFMESPDVPGALTAAAIPDIPRDVNQLSFFLGKESLVLAKSKTMAVWRKQIFLYLARNALSASAFFGLPSNRVVELGVQIRF